MHSIICRYIFIFIYLFITKPNLMLSVLSQKILRLGTEGLKNEIGHVTDH
jgi:hypothetical protein